MSTGQLGGSGSAWSSVHSDVLCVVQHRTMLGFVVKIPARVYTAVSYPHVLHTPPSSTDAETDSRPSSPELLHLAQRKPEPFHRPAGTLLEPNTSVFQATPFVYSYREHKLVEYLNISSHFVFSLLVSSSAPPRYIPEGKVADRRMSIEVQHKRGRTVDQPTDLCSNPCWPVSS